MSAAMMTNGRARKSLAEQIDRLDGILDGLADGLNEAVAQAVHQAVAGAAEQALRGALSEVLAHPEVQARLHGTASAAKPAVASPEPAAPRPSLKERLGGWASRLRAGLANVAQVCTTAAGRAAQAVCHLGIRLGSAAHQAGAATVCGVKRLGTAVRKTLWGLGALRRFVWPALVALAVGLAAGASAGCAAPWL